jgi:hypothetical protein
VGLEACPNCKTYISVEASACPKCGHPLDRQQWEQARARRRRRGRRTAGVAVVAGVAVGWMLTWQTAPPNNGAAVGVSSSLPGSSTSAVDHAGEMDTCKDEIGRLVFALFDWEWGR